MLPGRPRRRRETEARLPTRQKKGPRAAVWHHLFEPCLQGGVLRSALGNQVPEGKARSPRSDLDSLQIECWLKQSLPSPTLQGQIHHTACRPEIQEFRVSACVPAKSAV